MDADIVKRMREEEAALARKLKAVRDLLAAYGEGPKEAGESRAPQKEAGTGSREKVEITSFTEQTRRSVVLAMQALTVNPGLMKTRELVEFVEAMGHEISGQNKVNALGALLARSADIVGHGKSGWALADREKALAIVNEYAPKEIEPSSDEAVGSKPAGWGVAPPSPAPSPSSSGWPS
jgi:hypothetical protein